MELSKKFALVPESELLKHAPTKQHLSDLDKEMMKILNSHLSDFEKIQLYHELLKRKMNLQEFNQPAKMDIQELKPSEKMDSEEVKPSEEVSESPVDDPTSKISNFDEAVLKMIPTGLRKQTHQLIHFLKTDPDVFQWNGRGEILFKKSLIPKSNLADLISLILTQRKVKQPLNGRDEFLQALTELNVPKFFVKNKHLDEVLQLQKRPVKKRKSVPKWQTLF